MKRVALYVRVSTQEQAEEGYSVGAQLEKMRLYCKSKEWIIVEEYVDGGFSGSNLDRPAMQKLIIDSARDTIDMVLVYKLDRLSRSQKDTLHLIEDVFKPNGVDFTSMQENFDTSTPFGMAIVGILSVFAQLERSQIAERMTLGRDARAKEGRYLGHEHLPIGYDYDPNKGELFPIEYEAIQVKEVFRLFVEENLPINGIRRVMHKKYTQRYGDYSNDSTIRKMLSNPVYTGRFAYKGEIYESTHEPIIDLETFEKAQTLLDIRRKRHEKDEKSPFAPSTLLAGIVYCGNCGARFGGYTRKHKYTKKDGTVKEYSNKIYACYSRLRNPKMMKADRCDMRKLFRDELDALVWDEILSLRLKITSGSEDIFEKISHDDEIEILEKEIKVVDDKIMKLMDLYSIGSMPTNLLTQKISKLNDEKEKIVNQIKELDEDEKDFDRDEFERVLKSANEIKENGSLDEQRALIFALIERITIFEDHIHIKYRFN